MNEMPDFRKDGFGMKSFGKKKIQDRRLPLLLIDGFMRKAEAESLNSPWGLLSEICQIGVYPAEAQMPGYPGGPRVMDTLSIGRPSRPTHWKTDSSRTRITAQFVVRLGEEAE